MAIASALQRFHPFPARMAPEVAELGLEMMAGNGLVLDPMVGSGTSIAAASAAGLQSVGFDVDPLAIRLARLSVDPPRRERLEKSVNGCMNAARTLSRLRYRYPRSLSYESRRFIDYWFDRGNQIQLTALSSSIGTITDPVVRNALEVIFSSTIITKSSGVSLSADAPHSRPHRVYDVAPQRAFEFFQARASRLLSLLPDQANHTPVSTVRLGDARKLPLARGSADMIVTSPPYLNAIDYLRGHKLSLVWLGYDVDSLRKVRADAVGAPRMLEDKGNLPCEFSGLDRVDRTVLRYILDLKCVILEWSRVLRVGGQITCVIGDAYIRGRYVDNAQIVINEAERAKFTLASRTVRDLPDAKRYLPPPGSSNGAMSRRLKREHILHFIKEESPRR